MTDKELDNLLKKRLGGHSSTVPEDMWMRIISAKKERRTALLPRWSLLFVLLLFVGFGSWYLLTNDSHDDESEKNKTANAKHITNGGRSNDTIKHSGNLSSVNSQNSSKNKSVLSTLANKTLLAKGKKFDKIRRRAANPNGSDNGVAGNNSSKGNNLKIADNTIIGNNNLKNEVIKSKTDVSKDSISLKDSTNVSEEDRKENITDKIAIELYASPEWPINNITSINSFYENQLKKEIRSQVSYNIGARFSFAITKKLSAKIGVQFNQINEKVTFRDSVLSANSTYNNHYKSITIPLLLTYRIPGVRIIESSFTSGILLNLHSWYRGAIPSIRGEALNVNNMNVYNSNTGYSLYASVSLSKQMNNYFSLFAEPYFCYPLENMADKFQSFKQRVNTIGISFGVKYNLLTLQK